MTMVLGKLLAFRANQGLQQFGSPVDLSFCPNYSSVVKTPMDLGTVHSSLQSQRGKPPTVGDVLKNVAQVWENCRAYNQDGSDLSELATRLEEFWAVTVHAWAIRDGARFAK